MSLTELRLALGVTEAPAKRTALAAHLPRRHADRVPDAGSRVTGPDWRGRCEGQAVSGTPAPTEGSLNGSSVTPAGERAVVRSVLVARSRPS
jgi:hypothetical protein